MSNNTDLKGVNLKKGKNNDLILQASQYDLDIGDTGQYASAQAWITLKNSGEKCLVKNLVYDSSPDTYGEFIKLNGTDKLQISKYNNIIVPYIGSEIFNTDTVKYIIARVKGKKNFPTNSKLEYLITFDEKKYGEELWEGVYIALSNKSEDTLLFSKRLSDIKKFLKARKFPEDIINEVFNEFIKQEIFKKATQYTDNHNMNWALAINKKAARVFPAYDFDFCSGVKNTTTYETICDNGLTDLKSLIIQYKDMPWIKAYIYQVIQNYDIERVLEKATKETQIQIPNDIKQYFIDVYTINKEEMKKIYSELFNEKQRRDRIEHDIGTEMEK